MAKVKNMSNLLLALVFCHFQSQIIHRELWIIRHFLVEVSQCEAVSQTRQDKLAVKGLYI